MSVSKQPLKSAYIAYVCLSTILYRLPKWTICSIIPALRPRKSWSMKQSFFLRLLQYAMSVRGRYALNIHL